MKTIKQILKEKGNEIWSTTPDTFVFDALKVMDEKDIGAMLVMEKRRVVGIFSERDYARKVILEGKSSKNTTVREIMSTPVVFITQDKTAEQGMALMTAKHVRHLPVYDTTGKKLIGVISIGDLVKAIITEQKIVIDKLEKFISASPTFS